MLYRPRPVRMPTPPPMPPTHQQAQAPWNQPQQMPPAPMRPQGNPYQEVGIRICKSNN